MQETQETWIQPLGQEDPLEEEMATDSSTLAWDIPWTEEPGRLQSMGLQSLTWVSEWVQVQANFQRKKQRRFSPKIKEKLSDSWVFFFDFIFVIFNKH